MWKGYKVIDSDAHHHEPAYLWERYVAPEYRDRVPKVVGMRRNFFVYAAEDEGLVATDGNNVAPPEHHDKWMADKYGDAYDAWWSPEIRLRDMDRYGWDTQVILSTNANRVMDFAIRQPDVGLAMARAYHDWCRDYNSADPKRLKFTATLPAGDTPSMLEEARRAVEDLGAVSVRNPLLPPDKWLHEPEYQPLFQLASDLDFPISLHGEYRHRRAAPFRHMGEAEGPFRAIDHIMGFPMDNMTSLAHYIFGGILERFPKLRLGVLEANVGWAMFFLPRMDDHSHGRRRILGHELPMKPSEYVRRQCVLSADPDEPGLDLVMDFVGDDSFVWNTDYPHPDAPDPEQVLPWFDAQPISSERKQKVLWDNAVRLYGPRLLS
ncbi:MAG TPA: amidohydrolase family protein [Chloroflexota bacterium]|nr:amidohydrolase family protein [Chloroflexota bacterium]